MPATVLEWKMVPGKDLPEPVIKDDRETFPSHVVTQVLEWLVSAQAKHIALATKPEPIVIALGEKGAAGSIRFATPASPIQPLSFTHGRIELHMRDRHTSMVLATYCYLCAMSSDGRHIVGPQLTITQKGLIQ